MEKEFEKKNQVFTDEFETPDHDKVRRSSLSRNSHLMDDDNDSQSGGRSNQLRKEQERQILHDMSIVGFDVEFRRKIDTNIFYKLLRRNQSQ